MFSEDSQKILGLSNIMESLDTAFQAVRGAAFMDKPGIYVEQSKQYNFGQDGRSFNIQFPLLNTGTYEDVKRNWQFLFGLIYQNKPGRINRNLLELEGSKFSLVKSFKTSAKLCKIPKGPTTLGPFLNCTAPSTFLSK